MADRASFLELLPFLRCPETQQTLTHAPGELLERLLGEQRLGRLKTRAGNPVEVFQDGLLREDGTVFYPVREGIAVLLVDEALAAGE